MPMTFVSEAMSHSVLASGTGDGAQSRWPASGVTGAMTPASVGNDAMAASRARRGAHVRPGISVLLTDSIGLVRGRRVGLLTNQTGVDESGVSDIERLRGDAARAAGVRLM